MKIIEAEIKTDKWGFAGEITEQTEIRRRKNQNAMISFLDDKNIEKTQSRKSESVYYTVPGIQIRVSSHPAGTSMAGVSFMGDDGVFHDIGRLENLEAMLAHIKQATGVAF